MDTALYYIFSFLIMTLKCFWSRWR